MNTQRSVARPVANLGNTCYMNAVLQALAHAPELCLAMDCESHSETCPIYIENQKWYAANNINSRSASPTDGTTNNNTDANAAAMIQGVSSTTGTATQGTRKSRRTTAGGRKTPTANTSSEMYSSNNNSNNTSPTTAKNPSNDNSPNKPDEAAAGNTTTTTTGGGQASASGGNKKSSKKSGGCSFCALCEVERHIKHVHDTTKRDNPVAPSTFVNGFIEHVAPWFQLGVQEDSHEFLRLLIDSMQKSCQYSANSNNNTGGDNSPDCNPQDVLNLHHPHKERDEYPFSLFRGTVESNVVCESCHASSSTRDPIEDVGLEVTVPTNEHQQHSSPTTTTSTKQRGRSGMSRNTSPTPTVALADVQTAFQRFAKAEALDSNYKCEACGKVGKATKQSRLASIPPILTLHLKRFRYGDRFMMSNQPQTRRSGRSSEVSQLLGGSAIGKSGSAKIEGHIKFDLFFDLKPYLTPELQEKHSNMFCRLFAVIVHAGKNSHSGHYIAYVRNVSKNEWWKMDDSRVTSVTEDEVKAAEAYMLFYRIVQHPVAVRLEELHKKKLQEQQQKQQQQQVTFTTDNNTDGNNENNTKRPYNEICDNGVEWARKSNFPPKLVRLVQKVTELIADEMQISPQYYEKIKSMRGKNEIKITDDDITGGTGKFRRLVTEILYKLKSHPSLVDVGDEYLSSLPDLLNGNGKTNNQDNIPIKQQDNTINESNNNEQNKRPRVILEEPDECDGLL